MKNKMEKEGGLLFCRGDCTSGVTRDHWHQIFLVDEKPVIEWEFVIEKDLKSQITDEYWEQVHNLDYLVENFKVDPVDTERHINFRVQDANSIYSREEVERQHRAWHERQRTKDLLREKNQLRINARDKGELNG